MSAFDFIPESREALLARCSPVPEPIAPGLTRILPIRLTRCFEVQKLDCRGCVMLENRENCCRAGVVTAGTLELTFPGGRLTLSPGDGFFLPFALRQCEFRGGGEAIFALPPPPAG